MLKQIIFILVTLLSVGALSYSFFKIYKNFKLLKKAYPVKDHAKRFGRLFKVGFAQDKILRFPVIGFLHALVFWGFLAIAFGSLEMIVDGIFGTDRYFSIFEPVYSIVMATGDIFGLVILIGVLIFIFRRTFMNIKRFQGKEMTHKAHKDASFALFLILMLMITLLGMNSGYLALHQEHYVGIYPVSNFIAEMLAGLSTNTLHIIEQVNWWMHILLIFFFANYLPYSKHFHVFMSLPSVYFSRLTPLTQMTNMESVTKEVKIMMDPNAAYANPPEGEEEEIERFGMKDVEDGTWKNYLDSLTCTQCGRCTSVCPANITGKQLSPRKLLIDFRARMNEKSKGLIKEGKEYSDNKSYLGDYITAEEIWACTTCNACAMECPVNIDHPSIIMDMRRYVFMEESAAPSLLNSMSTNIENNGAPWQYPPTDRLKWADNLFINN